jgi:hypothetical protein
MGHRTKIGFFVNPISEMNSILRPPTPPNSVCGHSVEMSQMELEAFAAVQEVAVASFVKSIHISEVLVRTPDLLFLNLITLEGLFTVMHVYAMIYL